MIEIAKEGKLPKNIRQIGQVSGNQKVYLEDYVITYLKQNPGPDETMRVVVLYGKKEMVGDELCWFVSGAVLAEKDFFMEKTIIDHDSWQKVNEMAGRFFPELSVLGWAIIRNEPTKDIEEQIMRTQKQFFRQDQKLYFEYNTEEKFESIYLYEKGKMRLQTGYYIYYDRNECMQNYMVSLRVAERHPEEFESDRATHQFREVCNEKKQEIHRKRSATLMTCVSLVLVMVIMVIGVTMLNNYERMQSMEEVLYQISGKIDEKTREEENETVETLAADNNTADGNEAISLAGDAQQTQQTESGMSSGQEGAVQKPEEGQEPSSPQSAPDQSSSPAQTESTGKPSQSEQPISTSQSEQSSSTPQTEPTGRSSQSEQSSATPQTEPTGRSSQTEQSSSTPQTEPTDQSSQTEQSSTTPQTEPTGQSSQTDQSQNQIASANAEQPTTYIIQKGDTLAKICMQYYGNLSNVDKICEMNGIENKDNIFYGQKILLP